MTKYQLTPAPGYALVVPIKSDDLNKSEIATIENEKEHASTGEVIAIGQGDFVFEGYEGDEDLCFAQVGDIIAYIQYTEYPIRLNGTEYHQVRFDKITGVITEAK